MATRYEGNNGEPDLELTEEILPRTDKHPLHGVQSILLAWNKIDPVDDFERNRNEVIYLYQGNRNPFIDYPEFVEMIWGTNTSIENIQSTINIKYYQGAIHIDTTSEKIRSIEIYSISGQLIYKSNYSSTESVRFPLESKLIGIYLVRVNGAKFEKVFFND